MLFKRGIGSFKYKRMSWRRLVGHQKFCDTIAVSAFKVQHLKHKGRSHFSVARCRYVEPLKQKKLKKIRTFNFIQSHRNTFKSVGYSCSAQEWHSVAQNEVWNYLNRPLISADNQADTLPSGGNCSYLLPLSHRAINIIPYGFWYLRKVISASKYVPQNQQWRYGLPNAKCWMVMLQLLV